MHVGGVLRPGGEGGGEFDALHAHHRLAQPRAHCLLPPHLLYPLPEGGGLDGAFPSARREQSQPACQCTKTCTASGRAATWQAQRARKIPPRRHSCAQELQAFSSTGSPLHSTPLYNAPLLVPPRQHVDPRPKGLGGLQLQPEAPSTVRLGPLLPAHCNACAPCAPRLPKLHVRHAPQHHRGLRPLVPTILQAAQTPLAVLAHHLELGPSGRHMGRAVEHLQTAGIGISQQRSRLTRACWVQRQCTGCSARLQSRATPPMPRSTGDGGSALRRALGAAACAAGVAPAQTTPRGTSRGGASAAPQWAGCGSHRTGARGARSRGHGRAAASSTSDRP